jgi:DNA-binding NarL/FixJ family response regulator
MGIQLTAQPAEGRHLRVLLQTTRPRWLVIGERSDDAQIRAAIEEVQRAGLRTKVALLGSEQDVGRVERWIRNGIACYLSSSSTDDRVIQALSFSDQLTVVVVDCCFQDRLFQLVRFLEPDAGLSRRELQLLRLAANGMRTDEIAIDSHLTGHTVEFHFRNIISKLGARNRTQAVARAVMLGLVTISDDKGPYPT